MDNNSCNICNSLKYYKLHIEETHSYGICKSCGHVYQLDRKSQEYYNNIPYSVAQELVTNVDISKYDLHVRNRGNYIYDFVKEFLISKKINNLLDIGSGYGGVSYYLNKHISVNEVVGITPDYDENKFNKYDGIKFIKSTYDYPIDGAFDFIILVHTLEHFINPINALLNVKKNLSKNGLFYIEVPNFYWEKFIIGNSYSPVHLSYFTKNDLLNMMELAGFEVLKIKESKYWGNIKVLVKHSEKNNKPFEIKNENWILKLFRFKLNQIFQYPIYKFIKKHFKISPNS